MLCKVGGGGNERGCVSDYLSLSRAYTQPFLSLQNDWPTLRDLLSGILGPNLSRSPHSDGGDTTPS